MLLLYALVLTSSLPRALCFSATLQPKPISHETHEWFAEEIADADAGKQLLSDDWIAHEFHSTDPKTVMPSRRREQVEWFSQAMNSDGVTAPSATISRTAPGLQAGSSEWFSETLQNPSRRYVDWFIDAAPKVDDTVLLSNDHSVFKGGSMGAEWFSDALTNTQQAPSGLILKSQSFVPSPHEWFSLAEPDVVLAKSVLVHPGHLGRNEWFTTACEAFIPTNKQATPPAPSVGGASEWFTEAMSSMKPTVDVTGRDWFLAAADTFHPDQAAIEATIPPLGPLYGDWFQHSTIH